MTELNDKIKKAIADSLPTAVASELKTFIEDANQMVIAFEEQKKNVDEWRRRATELEGIEKDAERVAQGMLKLHAGIQQLEKDQMKFEVEKQLSTLRQAMMENHLADIKQLTKDVFGSNRMNYNVDLAMPVKLDKDQCGGIDYSTYSTEPVTGSIKKED